MLQDGSYYEGNYSNHRRHTLPNGVGTCYYPNGEYYEGAWSSDKREAEAAVEWSDSQGADEMVVERYMDARAASTPRVENDRPVTLLTEFEDIGLSFSCAPGGDIAEGVAKINDLLDWDETQDRSYFNQPKLYLTKGCRNLSYSLSNWTGKDGNKNF